jgi:hypothetical protein
VDEDHGSVRDLEREPGVLLDEYHHCVGLIRDAPHHRQELFHDDRREAHAHLVEQEDSWSLHEPSGDGEHLLFAT